MYTNYNQEYGSDNTGNMNNNNYNNNNNNYSYNNNSNSNKFFSIAWKVLLVIIIIVVGGLALVYTNVISFNDSSDDTAVLILNKSEVGLKVGSSYQLAADIYSENSKSLNLVFESSDPSVATVNSVTGYVTAIKEGTAVISVKSKSGKNLTDCIVNVNNSDVSIVSISINNKTMGLAKGYTEKISYTVIPSDATDLKLKFESSDTSVATVDANGEVMAVGAGSAIIKVTSKTSGVYDTCQVTVYEKNTTTISNGLNVTTKDLPKSITFEKTSLYLGVDSTYQLKPIITPSNASKDVIYESNNPRVVTVDDTGLIKAVDFGKAKIIARTINGLVSIVSVEVSNDFIDLTDIKINSSEKTIILNTTRQLPILYTPSNTTEKTVTWKSSDPSIISVTDNGIIRGLKLGKATITVTSNTNNLNDSIEIEVIDATTIIKETSVSFEKNNYEVNVNETISLKPIVKPDNATYKEVTFKSSNTKVATVDINGLVKGIGEGETTITATSHNGIVATTKVKVKKVAVTGLTAKYKNISISKGTTLDISYDILPKNATNTNVTCTSKNPKIVKVVSCGNGLVKIEGLKIDSTKITIKTFEGGYEQVLDVKVIKKEVIKPTAIQFTEKNPVVSINNKIKLQAIVIPNNANDQNITFSSNNPKIATVDSKTGEVTGLKKGTATIVAKVGSIKKSINVKVIEQPITNIELQNEVTLGVKKSITLKPTITPENASVKTLNWSSSDTSIATVKNGVVTAKNKKGTTTITVKTADGAIEAKCIVTVDDKTDILIKEISLNKTKEREIIIGESLQLTTTYKPENATNIANFTYSSDNANVATVDNNGLVKGVMAGKAKITVKTNNDKTASITVIVKSPTVTNISLSCIDEIALGTKDEALNVTFTPSNATPNLTWFSSNPKIIKINNGKLNPLKDGNSSIIYATVKVGKETIKSNECQINVVKSGVTELSVPKELSIPYGQTYNLKNDVKVQTTDEENTKIYYKGYKNELIEIDENGIITPKKTGSTTITVQAGDKTAKVKLEVTKMEITNFSIKELTKENFVVSDTYDLVFIVNNIELNKDTIKKYNITFKSSDNSIVSVNDDGKITIKNVPKNNQEITITATIKGNSYTKLPDKTNKIDATIKVPITSNPTGVESLIGKFQSSDGEDGLLIINMNGNKYSKGNKIREYRYSGSTVNNNYITFNDEVWRILGIFDVYTDSNSKNTEQLIKIVRNEVLSSSKFGQNNDWTKSTVMTLLNSEYGSNKYVQNVVYNLSNVQVTLNVKNNYTKERNKNNISKGNQATWYGAVGLMYPSDYGYTFSNTNWSDKMNSFSNKSTWLTVKDNEWLLSPITSGNLDTSEYTAHINSQGNLGSSSVANSYSVRPTLYLKSDVRLDGTGTSSDPYTIKE